MNKLYNQIKMIGYFNYIAKFGSNISNSRRRVWYCHAGMGDGDSRSVLEGQSPVFLQAMGGVHLYLWHWRRQKKRAGRTLEGRTWDEMPVNLVRV